MRRGDRGPCLQERKERAPPAIAAFEKGKEDFEARKRKWADAIKAAEAEVAAGAKAAAAEEAARKKE